jgi:hypothetical protein
MKVVCGPPSAGTKRPASAPRRKGGKRARLDARPRVVAPDQARDAAAAVDAFLHEHQRASSAFVAERERPDASYARGGLILDGMGAGKTVSMLAPVALEVTAALLADAPVPRTLIVGTETCWIAWRNEWATLCERCGISAPVVEIKQRITADALNAGALFIVAPAFVGHMWARMARAYPTDPRFRQNRRVAAAAEAAAAQEPGAAAAAVMPRDRYFFGTRFHRLIVDEVDVLRNAHATNMYNGIRAAHAAVRWGLTGTPIHRDLNNAVALMRFLGVPAEAIRSKPVNEIIAAVAMRRTAAELAAADPARVLPPMDVRGTYVAFDHPHERLLYQVLASHTRKTAEDGRVQHTAFTNLVNRLRGAALAPVVAIGKDDTSAATSLDALLEASDAPFRAADLRAEPWASTHSSKMRAMVSYIRENADRGVLVFLEWTTPLEILRRALLDYGGFQPEEVAYYWGKLTTEKRAEVFEYMSSNPACKVGLISTMAGNYSLNLARFSVIVFGMAAFDPQVEQQAMCRAWRQGQTRRVEVMYFITAGTYDEAVRKRAEERRGIAEMVLEAATNGAAATTRGPGRGIEPELFCQLFDTYGSGTVTEGTRVVTYTTVTADGQGAAARTPGEAWLSEALKGSRRAAHADNLLTAERLAEAIAGLPQDAAPAPQAPDGFAAAVNAFVAATAAGATPAWAAAGQRVLVATKTGRVFPAAGTAAVARAEAVERVLVRAPTLVVWPTARALHCAAAAFPALAVHAGHFLGGPWQFVCKVVPLLAQQRADGVVFTEESAIFLFRPADMLAAPE